MESGSHWKVMGVAEKLRIGSGADCAAVTACRFVASGRHLVGRYRGRGHENVEYAWSTSESQGLSGRNRPFGS